MLKGSSLFSQLLHHFPRTEFAQLVAKHQAEHRSKGFSYCLLQIEANHLKECFWFLLNLIEDFDLLRYCKFYFHGAFPLVLISWRILKPYFRKSAFF
ncbi:DUF4372 domain-containing protein [Desulforhopalus singaporensis]|uniref:DUF4372 domain-containing protein n=1 Tax=Desulforhopalus singaporensis TaxID=91360 RepID=UPI000B81CD0B